MEINFYYADKVSTDWNSVRILTSLLFRKIIGNVENNVS